MDFVVYYNLLIVCQDIGVAKLGGMVMQKKISPVLIVLALILVVAIAGAITFVVNRYKPSKTMADSSQYFGELADEIGRAHV